MTRYCLVRQSTAFYFGCCCRNRVIAESERLREFLYQQTSLESVRQRLSLGNSLECFGRAVVRHPLDCDV